LAFSAREAAMTKPIQKTPEEWKKDLSPEQFQVCRLGGTERAFTGAYWDNHDEGTYRCACCNEPLFASDTKFDSGSGWPSFHSPLAEEAIDARADTSHLMTRTEVTCRACGAHLGHVFDDGPVPTGLRYCINSTSLVFEKRAFEKKE